MGTRTVMRLLTLGLAALLLLSFQPGAAAKGCTIDLSDPISPRLQGDCIGGSAPEGAQDPITAHRNTTVEADARDELDCDRDVCAFSVTQSTHLVVRLNDRSGVPHFNAWVDVRTTHGDMVRPVVPGNCDRTTDELVLLSANVCVVLS